MFRELQYKHQTELYETYMQMQEKWIWEIIDQDENMRIFRHDLYIYMIVLRAYREQTVLNELRQEVSIEKMELMSSKKDKQNHSYGMNTVKTTVKKYGGSIESTCEPGWFQVDIII